MRLSALAAALWALTGAGPLCAQTLRIQPSTHLVPVTDVKPSVTFEVFIDGVPPPGLGSFQITLDAFHLDEPPPCLRFSARELDPDLKAAWGGGALNSIQTMDSSSIVKWTSSGFAGFPGPTGTVRLGTMTWVPQSLSSICFIGKQDILEWDGASRFGTSNSPILPFSSLQGGSWVLGRFLDVDLTVACTLTSPQDPNVIVDGQTLTLECLVSNLGSESTPITTLLQAVLSTDTTVGDTDSRLGAAAEAPALPGGGSAPVVISDIPVLSTAQTLNLCVKIDVKENDLNITNGRLAETNEANNVECRPITILEPRKDLVVPQASIVVTPDPLDPNGGVRAGLRLQVSYDLLNQGIGAVRTSYRSSVHLGSTLTAIQANPGGTFMCSKLQQLGVTVPFHEGGASLNQSYGLSPNPSDPNEICKIRFTQPPGGYVLAIRADSQGSVVETDPNGAAGPAEANNWASVPVTIQGPLPPDFRIYDQATNINDTQVDIRGPGTGKAVVGIRSARSLTAYGFTLSWDPPGMVSIGDPSLPGGDPAQVVFTGFLQQGDRAQSCAATTFDPTAGRLEVACSTTDPNGNGSAAVTEFNAQLLTVNFTAVLPGPGTITLSDLEARDGSGASYTGLRATGGSLFVSGTADLAIRAAMPPPAAYPGVSFTTSFDIENGGFGDALLPIEVEVVISKDASNIPADPNSPDLQACKSRETAPVPGRASVMRTLSTCMVTEDLRPGQYTAFYQLRPLLDLNSRTSVAISFPPRVAVLRESSEGQALETSMIPDQPGGSAGLRLARAGEYPSRSLAAVRSIPRDRNWLVRLRRNQQGHGRLQLQNFPRDGGGHLEVLREVRTPDAIRRILGAADIDGDGNDELILLRSGKGAGQVLDFRRLDYLQEWPEICQSAALTDPLGGKVASVTGIQFDGDPEDEIAVLDTGGRLSILDVVLAGSLPPASPCRGVPTLLEPPAYASLVLVASDPDFAASSGRSISICALDWQLDGVEELASLRRNGSGRQSLEILAAPSGIGEAAVLLADDPDFGGAEGQARALAITCTR